MSEDTELERLLERYRPAGPPASLRERVLQGGRPRRSPVSTTARWLSAAAAIFVAALLHRQASHTLDAIGRPAAETAARERAAAIDDMTELMGGDDRARRAAEQWYEAERMTAAATAPVHPDQETTWIR